MSMQHSRSCPANVSCQPSCLYLITPPVALQHGEMDLGDIRTPSIWSFFHEFGAYCIFKLFWPDYSWPRIQPDKMWQELRFLVIDSDYPELSPEAAAALLNLPNIKLLNLPEGYP